MIRINLRDAITPRMVSKVRGRLDLRRWMREGVANLVRYLRGYYDRKDEAEPNRFVREGLGIRRTHFWKSVGSAVGEPVIRGDSVSVTIKHPHIAQKVKGGPIYPVEARALTIPTHPDAYARTAAEVEATLGINLFIRTTALGDAFLMGRVKGRKGGLFRYFLLKRAVFQRPTPGAVPGRTAIREAFFRGVRKAIMGD